MLSFPSAATPASATARSFSTVEPETPIAPITVPSAAVRGRPPGKVIRPPLDASIWEERATRLGKFAQLFSRQVEIAGGAGLGSGDVDAAQPGAVHAGEGFQVAPGIDDGDIHLGSLLFRLRQRRCQDLLRLRPARCPV